VYDVSGKLVAEYSTVVEPPATAKVSYLTNDNLGTPRINTNANGTVIARHDYLPFGEEIFSSLTPQRTSATGYTADTIRKQFTGYERDNEINLDFAQARYYASSLGRFTSVDPLAASASAGEPQTYNRYTYVLNKPCGLTDSTGMMVDCPPDCPGFKASRNGSDMAEIASVTVSASGLPDELIPSSSSEVSSSITPRPLATLPELDVANAPPLKTVEGIARISEAGSALPGVGMPFAVIAGITRAGQGDALSAGLNLASVAPGFGILRKADKAADIAEKVKYIGRLDDLKNIPTSRTLLGELPHLGNPRANYYQNMSVLRRYIRDGYTIKDASFFRPDSELAPTLLRPTRTVGQTFLGAERLLLKNRGLWP